MSVCERGGLGSWMITARRRYCFIWLIFWMIDVNGRPCMDLSPVELWFGDFTQINCLWDDLESGAGSRRVRCWHVGVDWVLVRCCREAARWAQWFIFVDGHWLARLSPMNLIGHGDVGYCWNWEVVFRQGDIVLVIPSTHRSSNNKQGCDWELVNCDWDQLSVCGFYFCCKVHFLR